MPNSNCKIDFLTEYFLSYFKYKISKNLKLYMKKWSIFSLVSWGIFLLSAFYIKQVKLSAIKKNNLNANGNKYMFNVLPHWKIISKIGKHAL